MRRSILNRFYALSVLAVIITAAADASYRTWTITEVDTAYGLMGMANSTTPIVAGHGGCYAVTPAGNAWCGRGFMFEPSFIRTVEGTYTHTAKAPDGKMAFMQSSSSGTEIIGFNNGNFTRIYGTGGGSYIAGLAYDQQSNLYETGVYEPDVDMFTGTGWVGVPVEFGGWPYETNYRKIVFDSYNNIIPAPSYATPGQPGWQSIGLVLDIAISSDDIPAIVSKYMVSKEGGYEIICSVFDVKSASWVSTNLTTSGFDAVIEFDAEGNLCVATSNYSGQAAGQFFYNDGTGWEINDIDGIDTGLDYQTVSLDFDVHNNPVVAFGNQYNTIVAYDPVVVPEPGTLLFISAGMVLIGKKSGKRS